MRFVADNERPGQARPIERGVICASGRISQVNPLLATCGGDFLPVEAAKRDAEMRARCGSYRLWVEGVCAFGGEQDDVHPGADCSTQDCAQVARLADRIQDQGALDLLGWRELRLGEDREDACWRFDIR